MNKLENQLIRIEIAAELLKKASMLKTKQAAEMVGEETLAMFRDLIMTINNQAFEIQQLKERLR